MESANSVDYCASGGSRGHTCITQPARKHLQTREHRKEKEGLTSYYSKSVEMKPMSYSLLGWGLIFFTLSLSALFSTTGMFSSILLLSDASCGVVPFPTPRSLEITQKPLSGVHDHVKTPRQIIHTRKHTQTVMNLPVLYHYTLNHSLVQPPKCCQTGILAHFQQVLNTHWRVFPFTEHSGCADRASGSPVSCVVCTCCRAAVGQLPVISPPQLCSSWEEVGEKSYKPRKKTSLWSQRRRRGEKS